MSRREWKPGDVGLTAKGRLALRRESNPDGWIDSQGAPWSNDKFPTNVRPLVVIDDEDREQVERLESLLIYRGFCCGDSDGLADALRSLVTPPKPDEPTGLGAVVVAHCGSGNREPLTRWRMFADERSWIDRDGDTHKWADLWDVEVIHDGVVTP